MTGRGQSYQKQRWAMIEKTITWFITELLAKFVGEHLNMGELFRNNPWPKLQVGMDKFRIFCFV